MAAPPAPPPGAESALGVAPLVGRRVDEVERALILETLTHCLGNRTRAAEILGISIRTLRNKLHEYRASGVPVPVAPGQQPGIPVESPPHATAAAIARYAAATARRA